MFKRYQFLLVAVLCGFLGLGLTLGADALAQEAPVLVDAGVLDAGSGSATPAPALPDPVESPIESASTLYKLYKSGGLIPAIIVGLFFLLTALARKVKWLQEGNRALAVTGALAALTLLVEPATRGTTPTLSMIVGALAAGFALAMNPKKPQEV